MSLLAEAVSYLGIALMTASGALVTARFWTDLHLGGRLAIGIGVTLAGFVAGAVVARIGDQGSGRLSSFLQLLGTGGVALTAGVVAVAAGSHYAGVTALAVGPAVLAVSVVLWRNRERVLPFLSSLVGAGVTVVGGYNAAQWDMSPTRRAVVVWGIGLALGLLATTRRLHPVLPALIVAELASLVAPLFFVHLHHAQGLIVGLLTSLAALLVGMVTRHVSVESIAVVGCLVFLGYTLGIYVKGPAAAVAILVLGAVLVTLAVRAGLHHKGTPPGPRRFSH